MKKKKHIITTCIFPLIIIAAIAITVTGCGRGSNGDFEANLPENTGAGNINSGTQLNGEIITIRIPNYNWMNMTLMALRRREALLNEELAVRQIPAQLRMVMMEGPTEHDITFVHHSEYRSRAAAGEFADLTSGINSRPALAELNPAHIRSAARVGGVEYGIILEWPVEDAAVAHHSGLIIRTDILEELNAPLPATVGELIELSLAAKDRGLDYEIATTYSNIPRFLHRTYDEWPFFANSLMIYDARGNAEVYPGSDIFYRDAQILQQMNELGIIRAYPDWDAALASLGRNWDVLASTYPFMVNNEFMDHHTILQFEPRRANFSTFSSHAVAAVINRDSANMELALDVLEMIYTDREAFDIFVYGEPGLDFSIEADGSVTLTPPNIWFWQLAQHKSLARRHTDDETAPMDFHYVDESTLVTMPATQFNSENEALTQSLLESESLKTIERWRLSGDPGINIGAEISRLKQEGLTQFEEEVKNEYRMFLEW